MSDTAHRFLRSKRRTPQRKSETLCPPARSTSLPASLRRRSAKNLACVMTKLIVHHEQRLRRDRGTVAPVAGVDQIGLVVSFEHRIANAPLEEYIKAAAERGWVVIRLARPLAMRTRLEDVRRDIRENRRAADRRSSLPDTASISSRKTSASTRSRGMRQNKRFSGSIVRVRHVVVARHLIQLRVHHHAVHRLDAPAVLTRTRGQPIEQFRMRGPFAHLCRSCWACAQCLRRNGAARCGSPSPARSADYRAKRSIPRNRGAASWI